MAEDSFDDSLTSNTKGASTSEPKDAHDVDFRSKLNAQAEDNEAAERLPPLISILAVLDFNDSSCISTVRSLADQTFDRWEMHVVSANARGGSSGGECRRSYL